MSHAAGGGRLLLLGVSARALARSAASSLLATAAWPGGLVVLDYFADDDLHDLPGGRLVDSLALGRDIRRRRSVLALGRAALDLSWDAAAYAGGLENRPVILERLTASGRLLGNDAATVRRVRDPRVLYPFLRRIGIPHASTPQTGHRAPKTPGRRFLWKAVRSGSGGRVRDAQAGERRPRGHFLQEFVRGPVLSAAFVAAQGRAVMLGISELIVGFEPLGGTGFRYGGNITGSPETMLPGAALESIDVLVDALASRFGLTGLNGVDFVLVGERPHLIEVNPRYTASMEIIEDLTGRNLFDIHLEAIDEGRLPAGPLMPARDAPARLAKGVLYARSDVRSGDPRTLERLGCRDRPIRGESIRAGQPVCTILVEGSSRAACRRSLAARATRVRRTLRSREGVRRLLSARAGTC